MCSYMYTCIYVRVYMYVCVYIYAYIYICRICVYMRIYMHRREYMCAYMYMSIDTYMYIIYIHIYIYIIWSHAPPRPTSSWKWFKIVQLRINHIISSNAQGWIHIKFDHFSSMHHLDDEPGNSRQDSYQIGLFIN